MTVMESLDLYRTEIIDDYKEHLNDLVAYKTIRSNETDSMLRLFNDSIAITTGRKYAKVTVAGSVHSFVALCDDAKFKAGDILMAASGTAPARNFARGSTYALNTSNFRWWGACGALKYAENNPRVQRVNT